MKRWIIIGLTVFTIIMLILAILMRLVPDGKTEFRVKKINIKGHEPIYLKAWYGTNRPVTILTSNSTTELSAGDSSRYYIYNNLNFVFYRIVKDTVTLYVNHRSAVPRNFRKDLVIIQQELSEAELIQLKATYYYGGKRVGEF